MFNPFPTDVPLPYPLKTENLRFSDVLRRYRSGALVGNGLVFCFRGVIHLVIRKIFRKKYASYRQIFTRTCAYQGVRHVSFSENFAYVLNACPLMFLSTTFWCSIFVFYFSVVIPTIMFTLCSILYWLALFALLVGTCLYLVLRKAI